MCLLNCKLNSDLPTPEAGRSGCPMMGLGNRLADLSNVHPAPAHHPHGCQSACRLDQIAIHSSDLLLSLSHAHSVHFNNLPNNTPFKKVRMGVECLGSKWKKGRVEWPKQLSVPQAS